MGQSQRQKDEFQVQFGLGCGGLGGGQFHRRACESHLQSGSGLGGLVTGVMGRAVGKGVEVEVGVGVALGVGVSHTAGFRKSSQLFWPVGPSLSSCSSPLINTGKPYRMPSTKMKLTTPRATTKRCFNSLSRQSCSEVRSPSGLRCKSYSQTPACSCAR